MTGNPAQMPVAPPITAPLARPAPALGRGLSGHLARGAHAGPAAHDVAHREHADRLAAVDYDKVAEAAAHHRLGGPFERPGRLGEGEVRRQVVADALGVRALPGA